MRLSFLFPALCCLALIAGGCKGPKPVSPDIFTAIKNNNLEDVKRFVEHGVNLEYPTANAFTPLHMAVAENKPEIVKYLVEECKVTIEPKDGAGLTPLIRAAYDGNIPVAEILLKNKADIEAGDLHLKRPLHWATRRNRLQMVVWLLDRGADINALDDHNNSALMMAEQIGHTSVADLLRSRGAK